MTAPTLTVEEIEQQYAGQRVLLDELVTTPMIEIRSGRVLFADPDRDTVYRKAKELRPKRFAVRYFGPLDPDMVFVL